MKNKGVNAGLVVGIVLAVMVGAVAGGYFLLSPEGLGAGGLADVNVNVPPDSAYTATINGYDNAADSRTEIYADLFILDQDGSTIVGDGTGVNSSSVAYDSVLDVYPSGSDYYCTPSKGNVIDKNPTIVEVECYTPAAETSLLVELYDSDMDDMNDASNTSDECNYNLTFGEGQTKTFYSKFTNEDSNSVYMLGAVCGFYGGDMTDMELKELSLNGDKIAMTELETLPKEIDNAAWLLQNDSNVDQTGSWKICYVPESPIKVGEWDEVLIRWTATADADPTENTGDIFGIGHFDQSWNLDKNNDPYTGIDDGSDDEDVGNMGAIDEGDDLITPNDLNICASVEAL